MALPGIAVGSDELTNRLKARSTTTAPQPSSQQHGLPNSPPLDPHAKLGSGSSAGAIPAKKIALPIAPLKGAAPPQTLVKSVSAPGGASPVGNIHSSNSSSSTAGPSTTVPSTSSTTANTVAGNTATTTASTPQIQVQPPKPIPLSMVSPLTDYFITNLHSYIFFHFIIHSSYIVLSSSSLFLYCRW